MILTKLEFFEKWKHVISSNIKRVRYDEPKQQMEVTFMSGGQYLYSNVPRIVYEDLITAPSVGSQFYWNIRDNDAYPFIKIK